ncbi:MAG: metallophosphoesterase [Rhodoferax sp.]|uniref:metallophosphoesterase family protein n=1 Tax=Rhodoferax sp. TaxID=50421 RepID=UPI003BB7A93B
MSTVKLQFATEQHEDATSDSDFVLAHVSDLHLTSLLGIKLRDLLDKRISGYLSWRLRRRYEHRSEVLDALRVDLQAQRPDHIAVTGDLTHLGLPREFTEAAAWLTRLGTPQSITLVPGNHDAYVAEAWGETFAQWSAYMAGDDAGAVTGSDDLFPSLRIRRQVALIGLSTATPSAPFLATGRLGEGQLRRLDRLLEQTAGAGLFRIVLLHHPPALHTVQWRKSLLDSAALREVLDRRGVELVLHGHGHFSAATYLDAARQRNLAIGVPSASAIGRNVERYATYHVYRVRRCETGWRLLVSVRTYSLDHWRFVAEDGRRLRQALAQAPA